MSTPLLRLALAPALALALGAEATALDWRARAGVEYERTTSEAPQGPATTVPRLDVDLALDAGGTTPGVLDWGGGVQYRRTAATRADVDDVRDQLSFRLRSTLFSNPRSPVTATGHATRVEDDFSTDGTAAGSLLSTVYGGEVRLNGTERPHLRAGYTYSDLEQVSPLVGPADRTVHTVTAAAAHGAANYSFGTDYRGSFGEGTYAFDNFDDHRVDVDADVDVARDVELRVSDTYYLRQPTTDSAFNPRQELNSLSAALTQRDDAGNTQGGTYFYAHGLQSVPGALEQERLQHRLAYSILRVMPRPEWRLRAQADAAYTEDRLGEASARAAGQSLAGTVYWRRERRAGSFLELRAGPTVGVLEPEEGDALLGYGGNAGVTFARAGALTTQVGYDAAYASDLGGVQGTSLRQNAHGSAGGRLGRGTLQGTLQANSERRESPFVGSGATRSLTATLSYREQRRELLASAGLQDGVVGSAPGDGLFLAPPFDSHVRYAALDASQRLWRYVTFRGRVRTSSTDLPDRSPLDEREAYAAVELAYGALRFALEDRYVVSEVPGGSLTVNRLFLRVYRVIGSRF